MINNFRRRECFAYYADKLNVNDLEKICNSLKRIKRENFKSRQSDERKIEYKKLKNLKTVVESLNAYRMSVELGNYVKCFKCKANFNDRCTKVVSSNDEKWGQLSQHEDNAIYRRFEKMWLCLNCYDSEVVDEENHSPTCSIPLKQHVVDDSNLFYPDTSQEYGEISVDGIINSKTKVILPFTCEAVSRMETYESKARNRKTEIHGLYKAQPLNKIEISFLYEHILNQYKNAKKGFKYTANICDNASIDSLEAVSSESRVVCSSAWNRLQETIMKFRFDQYGKFCFFFRIYIPAETLDTVATCLIQDGIPVTINKNSDSNGEINLQYLVHLDHRASDECNVDCIRKVDLKDYLDGGFFDLDSLSNAHVTTYISSLSQKCISLSLILSKLQSLIFLLQISM